ncbi:MAG: phage holin family protein [Candidatus Shapirobacteria bacterium]
MIKRLVRYSILSLFALLITRQLITTPQFDLSFPTLLKIGLIFAAFEIFLKPLVKILFLPLNILTLGLFRFVISVPAFLLTARLTSSLKISDIHLSSSTWQGFVIPEFNFVGLFALIVTALTYSFFFYLLKSILIKK